MLNAAPQTTKHLDADDEHTSEARLPMNHNAKDQTTLTRLPPAVQAADGTGTGAAAGWLLAQEPLPGCDEFAGVGWPP
jgi:hypothetical protein